MQTYRNLRNNAEQLRNFVDPRPLDGHRIRRNELLKLRASTQLQNGISRRSR